MRRLAPVLMLVIAATACGSDATSVSSFDRIPTAVAFDWLNAVATADGEAVRAVVEPNGLAVVTAAENAFSLEETASLLNSGMSQAMSDAYWAEFREEFVGFANTPFRELEVGVYEEFMAGDVSFAAVTIQGAGGIGSVVASSGEDGWVIDMAATVGPAFVKQIRHLAEGLDDTAGSLVVMNALTRHVLPGLRAAVQLDPTNLQLASEVALIERALPSSDEAP